MFYMWKRSLVLGCTFSTKGDKGDGADMLWALVQLRVKPFYSLEGTMLPFSMYAWLNI